MGRGRTCRPLTSAASSPIAEQSAGTMAGRWAEAESSARTWGGREIRGGEGFRVNLKRIRTPPPCGGCVQHTPLVPNYPLSYSLQSRSRESESFMDAPAHSGPNTL